MADILMGLREDDCDSSVKPFFLGLKKQQDLPKDSGSWKLGAR